MTPSVALLLVEDTPGLEALGSRILTLFPPIPTARRLPALNQSMLEQDSEGQVSTSGESPVRPWVRSQTTGERQRLQLQTSPSLLPTY